VSVQLRTATDDDLDALRDVYRRSSRSNAGDRDALLAHPDALDFTGDGIDDGRTLVAMEEGRIVGFATLGAATGASVELDDLFVAPEHQRRGIGRALVADAARRARAAGAARSDVTANPDALEFYGSVGFVVVGAAETRFRPAPRMSLEIRAAGNEQP
jgi:GNAT superfamily N-acetyltransferase